DARLAFHAVNVFSVLLTGWLLLWLQTAVGVRPALTVFLTATFFLQWHAPLRQQFYDSFNVDAASQPFTCLILLVGLLVPERGRKLVLLSLLTFIGVFFRESVLFAT